MDAALKILAPGLVASIQDKGRFGFGCFGVPRSGAIDPVFLRLGNALVGNDPFEAAIEYRFMGPTVMAQKGSIRIGLAGDAEAELSKIHSTEKHRILPWQTVTLDEGDVLKVLPMGKAVTGYLTIEGGLQLAPVLGSKSTYARAGIGGATGALLQTNDVLKLREQAKPREYEKVMSKPPKHTKGPVHVILGPQDDYFSDTEIEGFLSNKFEVSPDEDRMGIRLEGTPVKSLPEKGNDLISDGLVAGAIQIPGNGQPIVLCADCHLVGGYPKIATVISADLFRLGQLGPKAEIGFKSVTLDQAQTKSVELEKYIEICAGSVQDYYGEGAVDLAALHGSNLISGVVNAQSPGHFPGRLEEI
ncbi:MAG: biotin-dependent carboxyltransferase family protein [Sneathiella sp.]|nr:biotin-dependent carboxyltransferase family protein [Sneathiella sp.]